jgi:hypothetical protein
MTVPIALHYASLDKSHFSNVLKTSDLIRAIRNNPETHKPSLDVDYLLKFPIEVWASSGEPFVDPISELNVMFCVIVL